MRSWLFFRGKKVPSCYHKNRDSGPAITIFRIHAPEHVYGIFLGIFPYYSYIPVFVPYYSGGPIPPRGRQEMSKSRIRLPYCDKTSSWDGISATDILDRFDTVNTGPGVFVCEAGL